MSLELEHLNAERVRLFHELSQVGDFRRGSINSNYRSCGKPTCACTQPDHPGHGPQFLLTSKVDGKTRARNLRQGPELETVQHEVANHQKFRELVTDIIRVNEQICDIKEADLKADPRETAKKGALKTALKKKLSQN